MRGLLASAAASVLLVVAPAGALAAGEAARERQVAGTAIAAERQARADVARIAAMEARAAGEVAQVGVRCNTKGGFGVCFISHVT